MAEFKIGDRVRYTGVKSPAWPEYIGQVGTIVANRHYAIDIRLDNDELLTSASPRT